STTNKSFPALSWGLAERGCTYSGKSDMPGGCAATAQCVAKPSAPYGGPCVYQAGDLKCPSGYPTKHLYYKGTVDSRDCTACTCGAPSGGSCTGSISLYSGPSCGGSLLNSFPLSSA